MSEYPIPLNPQQQSTVVEAARAKRKALTVSIPAADLMNGSKYNLKLTPSNGKKLQQAANKSTDLTIRLTGEQIASLGDQIAKHHQLDRPKGGFLGTLALTALSPAIDSITSRITGQAHPNDNISPDEQDPALARLRYLRGRGAAELKNDAAFLKGVEEASKLLEDPDAKKLAQQSTPPTPKEFTEKIGSGLDYGGASGWDSFWSGFKLMFTDPISGFELLGREIKRAVTGKGPDEDADAFDLPSEKKGTGIVTHTPRESAN